MIRDGLHPEVLCDEMEIERVGDLESETESVRVCSADQGCS